jgi:hypothetical protein
MCGCVVSQQEGERTHVNAADPDEIEFHFNTAFNRAVLFGRSALLLAFAAWLLPRKGTGSGSIAPIVLAVAVLIGSAWLLMTGWSKVFDYRIAVHNDALSLNVPSQSELMIAWSEIEEIEGEGKALDVTFLDGKGQAMKYASEWEDLTITVRGGKQHFVDLRPLSVEQRGVLWRAIARKAELQIETWVEHDKG